MIGYTISKKKYWLEEILAEDARRCCLSKTDHSIGNGEFHKNAIIMKMRTAGGAAVVAVA